ncbi:hypothetical protein Pst134EA_031502 [Puccinia striiformis f. sp. tritici]|uniref:uncharacterized protein n=1 Tax=Puccinia striiformis f. sp. tritici TaxID=168172 RepID=UPI0020085C06|nr:uncharacterized protein Pst134EA_031502 [Puccinia striiformis f. sp. tritici]KAH9445277.1 hypothetical protein Pst134EA_031502 [Puccinia striiformis f. sp. tritici]
MVRLQNLPGGNKSWLSTYDPEGHDGWKFIAEWKTDEYDCLEMRTGKPWSFQPDYHGILGIAHCLLFGTFMTEKDSIKPGSRVVSSGRTLD